MRLFAALVPPVEATEDLEAFLDPRLVAAPQDRSWRWAAVEQWHVTLAFYGEVPEARVDDLVERLVAAAARRRPPEVAVADGGAFPDALSAKVLWLGLRGSGPDPAADLLEVERLATGCRAAASRVGVRVDGRTFTPHLTLARMRYPQDVVRWLRVLDTYQGPPWVADRVTLLASYLGQGASRRPRYEAVAEIPLG